MRLNRDIVHINPEISHQMFRNLINKRSLGNWINIYDRKGLNEHLKCYGVKIEPAGLVSHDEHHDVPGPKDEHDEHHENEEVDPEEEHHEEDDKHQHE